MAQHKVTPMFEPENITAGVEEIDPVKAGDYLATAAKVKQRALNPNLVDSYVHEIKDGQWRLNGESIKFDRRGRLRDGQHRLNAVIVANTPIRTLVVRELEDADVDTVDTGRKRSPGDVLRMHGYVNSNNLAAALRIKLLYDTEVIDTRHWGNCSVKDLENVLAQHPDMEDCLLSWKVKEIGKVLLAASWRAWLRYEMRQLDRDAADEFEEKLYQGTDLTADHPIYKLRLKLLVNVTKEGRAKMQPVEITALCVKTWNDWRRGVTRQQLAWHRSIEPFPRFEKEAQK